MDDELNMNKDERDKLLNNYNIKKIEIKRNVEIEVANEMKVDKDKYIPISEGLIENNLKEINTLEEEIKTIEAEKSSAEASVIEIQKHPKKKTHDLLVSLTNQVEKAKKNLQEKV